MSKANHRNPSMAVIFLTTVLCGCSPNTKTVAVPEKVNTVAAGLPFALQIKNAMVKDAHLATVLVDLNQDTERLQVEQITYGFAFTNGQGRMFAITVDNLKHEAFIALDAPEIPKGHYIPEDILLPLDLMGVAKEITEVLAIAQTNGLADFCTLAPGKKGSVRLSLGNNDSGIVWGVTGDGWDEKGPIADLSISIDAKTGSVLKHALQKSVGR